ncbi:MAG: cytochrome P450 [Aggregatilineales bacterium]
MVAISQNPTTQSTLPQTAPCPAENMRKTGTVTHIPDTPVMQAEDGVWHISGFNEVRQVLRHDAVIQAGFSAERTRKDGMSIMKNPPILFLDGEEHHRMRRETNRFFTPAITDRDYRDFMDAYADELMARLQHKKRLDLSDISMDMAVRVASKVVGLTSSIMPHGMKARLESLIALGNNILYDDAGRIEKAIRAAQSQWNMGSFYLLDVQPAIRARRKTPQNDVISYLLERDYSGLDILTECLVYGVAGMVTTREFISVALWHLLENPHLAERMRVGEQKERYAILHEILRLEPVVSHLYRRAQQDITIESNGQTMTIPAGAKMDLYILGANIDETVVGNNPMAVCPMREMTETRPKVQEMVLSFGDGAHRCPGAYVAIQESDIFLRKLLAQPGLRIEQKPNIAYSKIIESYELRDFIISVD